MGKMMLANRKESAVAETGSRGTVDKEIGGWWRLLWYRKRDKRRSDGEVGCVQQKVRSRKVPEVVKPPFKGDMKEDMG